MLPEKAIIVVIGKTFLFRMIRFLLVQFVVEFLL